MEQLYETIIAYLKQVRTQILNDQRFEIEPAVDTIRQIIDTPELIQKYYHATVHVYIENDYLISHSANALHYALKIGSGLKYSREELLELGLSALFYDVGMFKIPDAITRKEGKLTDSEADIIRTHTEMGRQLLAVFGDRFPLLSRVAYEHHERENGEGYPRNLKGDEICDFAKIIGIVDTYEAMTHNRPHRRAFLKHSSVKELISSKTRLFSPRIIRVYLEEIGLFPVGSYVKLNNNSVAEVIEINVSHPMKPLIKLLYDSHGNKAPDGEVINLSEHPIFYVAAALHEDDLPQDMA